MNEFKKELLKLIETEMGVNLNDINPDRDIREQIDLDSMQMVSLSAKVEERYNIELPLSVMGVTTLNEFISIVENEVKNCECFNEVE